MAESRKLRVFLCHASQDKPVVRKLYQKLLAEGWIDPWLDEAKLLPGQDFDFEIRKAVETADAVIVCLSRLSVAKEGYVQQELRNVLNASEKKPSNVIFIIPIRFDECSVPHELKKWQFEDYFPENRKDWAYGRLLQSLKARGKELNFNYPEFNRTKSSNKTLEIQFYNFGELEYAKVPSGSFLMGSSISDENSSDVEKPLHEFNIEYDYFLSRYAVTNLQYATFARDEGITFKIPKDRELHPVVYVSWFDAVNYVQWLNRKYKKGLEKGYLFSLPSETEWEKAARSSDGRIYPWGDGFDNTYDWVADLGRDRCNIDESRIGETVPISHFSPMGDSPYGVANMSGNVWEWTRSLWALSDKTEPDYGYPYEKTDGREDENNNGFRILRGGSFFNNRWYARCAYRGWDKSDVRYRYAGMRIAIIPTKV